MGRETGPPDCGDRVIQSMPTEAEGMYKRAERNSGRGRKWNNWLYSAARR